MQNDKESILLNKIGRALLSDFPMINLVEINDKIIHKSDTKGSDCYVLFDVPVMEDYLTYNDKSNNDKSYNDKSNTACRRRPEVIYFNLDDTFPLIRGKLYLKFKFFAEAKAETQQTSNAE